MKQQKTTIQIFTACAASKCVPAEDILFRFPELADLAGFPGHDPGTWKRAVEAFSESPQSKIAARQLYTGLEHKMTRSGVDAARANGHRVDWRILSAGFGLVKELDPLYPYECTFKGMRRHVAEEWGRTLRIKESYDKAMCDTAALKIVALGEEYLRQLYPLSARLQSRHRAFVYLTSAKLAEQLRWSRPSHGAGYVPIDLAFCGRYGAPLTALKGRIAGAMLRQPGLCLAASPYWHAWERNEWFDFLDRLMAAQ